MTKQFNPTFAYSAGIMEGYDAYYQGEPRESCPHPESEDYLRWCWLEGWDLAHDEHKVE